MTGFRFLLAWFLNRTKAVAFNYFVLFFNNLQLVWKGVLFFSDESVDGGDI